MDTTRFKRIVPWLAEARYVWLALFVCLIAFGVSLRPGSSEQVIRLTGLVLQILGLATVAWGISETRALYGHRPWFSIARGWIERFPLRRRSVVLRAEGIVSAAAVLRARAHVTHSVPPGATVEERLSALEKNIGSIHERIGATQKDLDEHIEGMKSAVNDEAHKREVGDAEGRKLVEITATGGVHITAIGAFWLFVGVTLSTASGAIAGAIAK